MCRTLRDSAWPVKFELLKAEILLNLDRAEAARPLLERAQTAIVQWPELKARLLMDQAEWQKQCERPEQERALLAQARDLASHGRQGNLLAWIEMRRGLLFNDVDGDFPAADAALQRALDLAKSQGDESLIAGALGNLGYIRLRQARYDEAIPLIEAADVSAQRIPSKIDHEKCLGNLGWCYFRLGQLDRALDLYSRAEPLAAEIHVDDDQERWLGNIGSIHYVRRAYDKAIEYYTRAYEIAQRVGDRGDVANWLNNITSTYIDQSNWVAAEKFNRLALDAEAGTANTRWVAGYSRLNSGFIAIARERADEAERNFRAAIEIAKAPYQPNVAWLAHSGLAQLYRSQKLDQDALREYAAAVQLLDRAWLALSRDESKITFRNYLTGFYQDYVGFLSERHQPEQALEVAEASRARLLTQKLEGRLAVLPRFAAADGVRLARDTRCALLSYWLAPERSYVWVVTANGISQFTLPPESEISRLLVDYRRAIEGLEDPLAVRDAAAQRLYQILVRPAEPLIRLARQILIVPDGPLHKINFETLVRGGANPHYWIEDATIALVPSLSVLETVKRNSKRRPRLLIIGDPLPADPQFPPLQHLKSEIQEIAAGFPNEDRAVFTGAQADAQRLAEAGPRDFTAIHFAAHASANEETPLNSAIILSPRGPKYKLYANEVADLRLDLELVTISACRSAGSRAYSGEGLIGFAWAFLQAGAHNVVGGIWNVDDAAAPLMMKEFYGQWRLGQNPPADLRSAKLKLMRSGGAFRKPYYWGPFEVFTRYATRSAMDLAWRNKSR